MLYLKFYLNGDYHTVMLMTWTAVANKTIKSCLSRNRVLLNTYLSWKVDGSFDADVVDVENCRIVRKIKQSVIGNIWTKFDWIRDWEERRGANVSLFNVCKRFNLLKKSAIMRHSSSVAGRFTVV